MRRARDLKEHRDALRRKAVEERQHRRKQKTKKNARHKRSEVIKGRQLRELKYAGAQVKHALKLDFVPFEEYTCQIKSPPLRVCHVIESLGMGGGQTMMMELVQALNKYYSEHIHNIVCCPCPGFQNYDKGLFTSYGVAPAVMREKEFSRFLVRENIQLVLQHRLAVSKCLKRMIPSNVKYVVMNHTYHQLGKLSSFLQSNAYVSVCKYLHQETRWSRAIHPSRTIVILNGVENDYLADVESAVLEGDLKTGRCHRLVSSKFRTDSLKWMEGKVKEHIPGHRHYLIGHNAEAKKICKKNTTCKYFGAILTRSKKMAIIKALDLYFYETFGHEGASIAILEALACGVPVLCRNFGGNKELIQDGVNGYVLATREEYLMKMKDLQDKEKLDALKASTIEDFNKRLHIKHTATKYMQLFEKLMS